jgi:UDP-glucose 4-epimerase
MKLKKKNILVTGGAGYIGSHVCHLLIDQGYKVTCIDNLIRGNRKLLPKKVILKVLDIENKNKISDLIKNNKFDLVMHFAGLTRVDESIKKPKKYYRYNFEKAKIFIETCLENGLNKIIFSSSASVYGNPNKKKVSENDPLLPLNPYAKSKLKLEKFLMKYSKKKINYIILRYFNVAGADEKLRTGLISKSSTNLIKVICEVATGKRKKLVINGNNYNTKDGTPIRDFIHVSDLAQIHLLTAKYLLKNKKSKVFNCGYGKGFSILDVVKNMNTILNRNILTSIGAPRKKDIKISIANTKKFNNQFKWKPKFDNLKKILKTAYDWERKYRN